jgi:hypothetical protein
VIDLRIVAHRFAGIGPMTHKRDDPAAAPQLTGGAEHSRERSRHTIAAPTPFAAPTPLLRRPLTCDGAVDIWLGWFRPMFHAPADCRQLRGVVHRYPREVGRVGQAAPMHADANSWHYLAEHQHGVVSRSQLLDLGLS